MNSQTLADNRVQRINVDVRWIRLTVCNSHLENIANFLSSDEIERVQRTRIDSARRAFVQTRMALRAILGNHLNRPPSGIKFSYSTYGKPKLDSIEHAGQSQLHFNVSHSQDVAMIAICENARLGVDIEYRHRERPLQDRKLARRYFSQYENNMLDSLAADQYTRAFYTGWVRKEAYAKAQGLGIQIGLQTFDVNLSTTEPAQLINTRPNSSEAQRWSLRDLDIDADYAAALAIECTQNQAHIAITQFHLP